MRRRLLVVAAAVLVAGGGVLLLAGGGEGKERYRVDVVFDHARGLIPGQLVQIAGGRVGEIEAVSVTADFKARLSLSVDARFAPFREDARCTIRPQGLIAENYVECFPGTPDAAALRAQGEHPPTVPVERTTQPVNLTDLFEIWNVPTRDRLGVLVSELGISTAARGEDLNALLRRANPALEKARRVLGVLERQRDELGATIDSTSAALAELRPYRGELRALAGRAGSVLSRTGRRSADIALATGRLPGLLRAAQPALERLDAVAEAGVPLLAQVHRAAPTILALTQDGPALAAAARPALAKLGPVLDRGTGIARTALPLSRALRVYAKQSLPSARIVGRLLPDLDDNGFPDNLVRFLYYATLATARFDSTSHILPAHIDTTQCANYATTPVAGCSANYNTQAATRVLDYLLG